MKNIWENYNFNDMGKEKTTNKELKVEEFRNVKDTFNTIQEWVSKQDKDKVKLVKGERVYDGRLRQFQDTMDWFDEMNKLNEESKSLLFGETTLTIEDIKENMLLHLKGSDELLENTPDEDEDEGYYGDYDDCGHASAQGYQKVLEYFEELDEQALLSIAAGSTQDDYEVDINGGRSYLMSRSNIYLYIFNYFYYTKRINKDQYNDDILCNSGDASEALDRYYLSDVYLPSDEEFDKMYSDRYTEKYKKSFNQYNSMINNIISNFKGDVMLKELVDKLSDLRADDSYIQAKVRENQIDKIIK